MAKMHDDKPLMTTKIKADIAGRQSLWFAGNEQDWKASCKTIKKKIIIIKRNFTLSQVN